MDFMTAVLYGVIQGISEFLPVSSSGHLALMPFFMTISDPGVVFDLCMHVGTAVAVMVYFKSQISSMCQNIVPALKDITDPAPELVFLRHFILATFASVVVILLLKPFSEHARSPWIIAFNQAFFGLLLWVADIWQRKKDTKKRANYFSEQRHWKTVVLIGVSQALAIFPGVSRSGITLTAAYFSGVDRAQAGAFSFLLSLPIIIAGVIVEIPDLLKSLESGQQSLLPLMTGMLVSFVVGYGTIHLFMKLIARIHLGWFTGYRLALAVLLVFLLLR